MSYSSMIRLLYLKMGYMMKVLAIIGSPRAKGNTYSIVDRILANLIAFDPLIELEYVFLSEHNFHQCTGCQKCLTHGIKHCPLKDDMATIIKKIDESQGIILASPVYAAGVPAIFKTFIDRLAYLAHRPAYFDKTFLSVVTDGLLGHKITLKQMEQIVSGSKYIGHLHIKFAPVPTKRKDFSIHKINRTSIRFYRSMRSLKRKTPSLYDFGWFYTFKTLLKSPMYQSYFPADYAYYKDKKHYFYKIKGHYLKRLLGIVIGITLRNSLKAKYDLVTDSGQLYYHRKNFHQWLEKQNELE